METPPDEGSSLNYEQLGAEAAKLDHQEVDKAAQAMMAPGAAAVGIAQVCTIYTQVKPFLDLIVRIPFIPANIKTAIRAFSGAMNLLCP